MTRARVVLHVGAGHLGTSTLQEALDYDPDDKSIVSMMSSVLWKSDDHPNARWLTLAPDEEFAQVASYVRDWARATKPRVLLVSDEHLSAQVQPPERLAKISRLLTDVGDVHVLMVLSNPVVAAPSAYLTALLYSYWDPFDAAEVSRWHSLDHEAALIRLDELNASTTLVVPMDYSVDFLPQYSRWLSTLSGAHIELPPVPRSHLSLTRGHARALAAVNQRTDLHLCRCQREAPALIARWANSGAVTLSYAEAEEIAAVHAPKLVHLSQSMVESPLPWMLSAEEAISSAIALGKVADGPGLAELTSNVTDEEAEAALELMRDAPHGAQCTF